jgi:hypothetical protein
MESQMSRYSRKSVHMKNCYDRLLDAFEKSHPGKDPPSATLAEATRTTLCPKCGRVISPGEQIAVTMMAEWVKAEEGPVIPQPSVVG